MLNGLDEFDVVCFDNIEHIAGNAAWERAFFNFFNQQRERGHKLVVSASSAPNDIARTIRHYLMHFKVTEQQMPEVSLLGDAPLVRHIDAEFST